MWGGNSTRFIPALNSEIYKLRMTFSVDIFPCQGLQFVKTFPNFFWTLQDFLFYDFYSHMSTR